MIPFEEWAIVSDLVSVAELFVSILILLENNVKQPLIVNAKIGNVSDKGFAIAACFSMEQFFFKK